MSTDFFSLLSQLNVVAEAVGLIAPCYTTSPSSSSSSRLVCFLLYMLAFLYSLSTTGAGLSGLSTLFGLCGAAYHRAGTVFMTLTGGLAFLVTLIAWIAEMSLFGIARNHMRDSGINATWGNANWLVLGALVALFIAFVVSLCGSFGCYRKNY